MPNPAGFVIDVDAADGSGSINLGYVPEAILLIGTNQDADGFVAGDPSTVCIGAATFKEATAGDYEVVEQASWRQRYDTALSYIGAHGMWFTHVFSAHVGGGNGFLDIDATFSGALIPYSWTDLAAGMKVYGIAFGNAYADFWDDSNTVDADAPLYPYVELTRGDPDETGAVAVGPQFYGTTPVTIRQMVGLILFGFGNPSIGTERQLGGGVLLAERADIGGGYAEWATDDNQYRHWAFPGPNPDQDVIVHDDSIVGGFLPFSDWAYMDSLGPTSPFVGDAAGNELTFVYPAGYATSKAYMLGIATTEDDQRAHVAQGVQTDDVYSWDDAAFRALAILTIGPSFETELDVSTSELKGVGFGLHCAGLSAACGISVGSGGPYSWSLPDRSWVSDVDRDSIGDALTAGTIISRVGEVEFVLDDDDGTLHDIAMLGLGNFDARRRAQIVRYR